MKIIPKFRQGDRFNVWLPIQFQSSLQLTTSSSRRSSKSEDDDDEKGRLTEKDLFTMLKDVKGLPNEMLSLFSEFSAELLMARDLGQNGIADITSTYASTLAKLKQFEYNKEIFRDAYNRAVAAGNLNDIAITVSGHVMVKDNGKIKPVTPEQYAKHRDSYVPITNSNLLYLRSHSLQYVGRNDIYQTVENGISLENVSKMIQERIQLGGKITESSENFLSQEGVKNAKPADAREQAGLKILLTAMAQGPEGFYKIHNEHSNNQAAVDAAFAYIYSTLPNNAKVRLALETKNGTLKEAAQIIKTMLVGKLEDSTKLSVSYVGTKGGTTADGVTIGGGLEKEKETAATRFLKGYGDIDRFNFNMGSTGNISVEALSLPLVDSAGSKLLGNMQPISEVSKTSYAGSLDWENASMGMGKVSASGLNQIVEKNGRIYSIDFPVYRTQDGHIVPDLRPDRVERKLNADKEIKAKGIDINNTKSRAENYETINKIYEKYGLAAPYNSSGDISNDSWKRFAVMEAYADNRVLEGEHPSLLKLLGDYEEKNLINTLKETSKNYTPGGGFVNWVKSLFGGKSEGIYEGLLWVPMPYGYNSALITQDLKTGSATSYDLMDLARRIPIENEQTHSFGHLLSN